MKHIKLSVLSFLISSITIALYCVGYKGVFLFVPTLVAFMMAVKAYTYNASANLTVVAGFYVMGIIAVTTFMVSHTILIPIGYVLIYGISHFKMRYASFSYSGLLFVEPLVAIIGLVLIIYGGIKVNFTWDMWVFASIPAYLFFIINMANYYDRTKLNATQKNFTAVGEKAEEFSLSNQDEQTISLGQFKGQIVLLVFVRGDWCPGCHIMLRTYEKHREALKEAGVTLLCIGPDPVGINKEMATKIGIKYHILSDPGQVIAMKYTVELQQPLPNVPKDYKGIPLPAAFLIDKEGIIRHTSNAEKAGEILNPQLLIETLKGMK